MEEVNFSKEQMNWKVKYKYVVEYYNEHGNSKIPREYIVGGYQIGRWLDYQKQRKNGVGKPLSPKELNLLEKIDIPWDSYDRKWQIMFQCAKEYYQKNHHLYVPRQFKIDDKDLGNWINRQRALYKAGLLDEDRIKKLNSIQMIWDLKKYCFLNKKITPQTKKEVKIKLLKELEQILNETNKVDEIEKNFVKKLSL